MQAPGKDVNDAGSKASKKMRGNVNKSSLERGSLEAALMVSMEVHTPEKGVKDAGTKLSVVVQDLGKGSQEEISETS